MQTSLAEGRSTPYEGRRRNYELKQRDTTTLVVEPPPARNFQLADHVLGVLARRASNRSLLKRASFRCFDLVGAGLLAILFLPIMLVTALLVKVTSPGQVLYGSARVAQDGSSFKAWKFRSMVTNGDEVLQARRDADPAFNKAYLKNDKLPEDPRITKVGRWIRYSSIDELPQLWNVLRGEMSLVGPRPKLPNEVERYQDFFELVCSVRPGLTGLWQISGRSALSFEDRIALDVHYVLQKSLIGDIGICLKTSRQIVFPSSDEAY